MTEFQKMINSMTENERVVFVEVKNATFDNPKPRKDITRVTGIEKKDCRTDCCEIKKQIWHPCLWAKT